MYNWPTELGVEAKSFSSRIRNTQEFSALPLLLNVVLKMPEQLYKNRQTINKVIYIGREAIRLFLYADGMILYVKHCKD